MGFEKGVVCGGVEKGMAAKDDPKFYRWMVAKPRDKCLEQQPIVHFCANSQHNSTQSGVYQHARMESAMA